MTATVSNRTGDPSSSPPARLNDVLLSNGFSRFQLIVAASELQRRGRLAGLVTGSYPTARVRAAARSLGLADGSAVGRLLDRGDAISDEHVRALWLSEIGALFLRPLGRVDPRLGDLIAVSAMRAYGRGAARSVRRAPASTAVYHYRAGFGHSSVEAARRRGLRLLCDHSIAHPAVVGHLVSSGGRLPARGERPRVGPYWASMLADIERADEVLVNSDFVKQTFVHCGWPAEKVHVLYWGIDDAFLDSVPRRSWGENRPMRLLFAGLFDRRKGADELVAALNSLPPGDWRLDVAGPIESTAAQRHGAFLAQAGVEVHGTLRRRDLAQLMSACDVFVFPSRAEGSARVVFEALACGCFVVTTPNAGSIVEDGVHGRLVAPADPSALAAALAAAIDAPDEVASAGRENARLVASSYRQRTYGDGLEAIYETVLGGSA
jgi:glycosyltransferase involved in cell wall biosynthesis